MPQRFDAQEVQLAIRKYIFKTKVPAARAAGEELITLRASELHGALNLKMRVVEVAAFMDRIGISEQDGLKLLERSGPKHGGDAKWVFGLVATE